MKSANFFAGLFATVFTTCFAHADIPDVTPAAACNYLATIGLRTTTYRQQADGLYRCISPSIDIGTTPGTAGALNNITYSVSGSEQSVAAIKLVINVYNPREATAIHRRLKDVASTLAQKLGIELPNNFQQEMTIGSGAEAIVNNRKISIVRIDQASGGGGYAVTVFFK